MGVPSPLNPMQSPFTNSMHNAVGLHKTQLFLSGAKGGLGGEVSRSVAGQLCNWKSVSDHHTTISFFVNRASALCNPAEKRDGIRSEIRVKVVFGEFNWPSHRVNPPPPRIFPLVIPLLSLVISRCRSADL